MNGDVNGDGVVNIADALEILKFLAKLDSAVHVPSGTSPPTINDALEILKYLAKLDNKIVR
jgi:hypothetical protein